MKKSTSSSSLGSTSLRMLARTSGIHRDSVQATIVQHNIKPTGQVHGHDVHDIEAALTAIIADAKNKPVDQRARLAGLQAEIGRLKLGVDTGELVPRAEVERTFGSAFQTIAMLIDILPDLLEREGVDRDAVIRIAHRLDEMRIVLAEQLRSFETPPAPSE